MALAAGESLGKGLAAQAEVGMGQGRGSWGCHQNRVDSDGQPVQGGELQRSRGFHCGIVKLTIHLIIL